MRFTGYKILRFSCAPFLITAGTGLPLGASQSSEAQEAEDPPSFTHAESENKNIACRHVSEGIRKQCPSGFIGRSHPHLP